MEKLNKLKEAALLAHEEQERETIEQDEIIEQLLEENKTLKKLLTPFDTQDFIVSSPNLVELIKEGAAAIKGRQVDKKVSEQNI